MDGQPSQKMCREPEVVQSTKRATMIVSTLLMVEAPMSVVGIVFKTSKLTGDICLITLHSPTLRRAVVFDVYRNPKLYMEGQIHRIFQADKLVKIVHDCKYYCAQLRKQHYIKCNSMFDTQVAYTLQMELNGLPPRLILYKDLHRNIVGLEIGELYSYVKLMEPSDSSLWCKRPIPVEMLYALGEEVTSLRCEVYPHVLSALEDWSLDEFEMRCVMAAQGTRKVKKAAKASKQPPLLTINTRQAELLPHTKSLQSTEPHQN